MTPRYDNAFYVLQSQHWYSHAATDTMYLGESANTISLRGTLNVNSTTLQGTAGRNYFKDSELSTGAGLRVGAAWGLYGIYAESGNVVVGAAGGMVSLQNGGVTAYAGDLYVNSGTNYTRIHNNGSDGYIDTQAGNLYIRPAGALVSTSAAIIEGINDGSQHTVSANNGTLCWTAIGTPFFWDNWGRCISTRETKDNITDLSYGLETIRQLKPRQFDWKSNGVADFGFIADEVEAVNPLFAEYDSSNGNKLTGVHYLHMSALMAKGIQQLDIQVQANDARLGVLEAGNFSGNLSVAGNATINGALTVQGTTTLATLNVTSSADIAQLTIGRLISKGVSPTTVLGATTGINGVTAIDGNDTAGTISYTAGTPSLPANPLAAGEQVIVTFNKPYALAPRVTLTPNSEKAANMRYYVMQTATEFKIVFTDTPVASDVYSFNYQIIQ